MWPRAWRYLWAGPTTLPGLLLVGLTLVTGGRARVVTGVIEAHGGLARRLLRSAPIPHGAAAMTLGHVVLGQTPRDLDRTRRHERVHVAQAERWGPLFYPAYALSSLTATLAGRHYYFGNRFEIEAYAAEAGGTAGVNPSAPATPPGGPTG